ncbi:hypothetical protein NC651_025895 [Populus alba x Populus x berolinensis]|nr:hypothetical protein NC651_025895 [Populus alba x Populus x berolinensis]
MGTSGALSSGAAAAAACSAFPCTDITKFKFKSNALFSPNPRRNCCCYSIITPTCTATVASTSSSPSTAAASSTSSKGRRKTLVSCSMALRSTNYATMASVIVVRINSKLALEMVELLDSQLIGGISMLNVGWLSLEDDSRELIEYRKW